MAVTADRAEFRYPARDGCFVQGGRAHVRAALYMGNGCNRRHHHRVPVSHTLVEEYIGFAPIDDGLWDLVFFTCRRGRFEERVHRGTDDRGRLFRYRRV